MLEFRNVYKSFKKKEVLCDVNYKLSAGEKVGLIGSNGSGKSTLMKLIAKTQLPSKGNVYFNNIDIHKSHNMIKDFSFMIGQIYYPELNARQNIENYLKINNKISYISEIQKMLNIVGLEDNEKKVKNYSYGMKQRLCLAICLITKPKVAVLDEPFLGLDPLGVRELNNIIEKYSKEKNTLFLISSHQLKELEDLCDRFLLLENHQIREIDLHNRIFTQKLIFKNTLNNAPELKANFNFIKKIDSNSITIINKDEEVDLTNLLNLVGKNPLIKIESNDNLLSSYFYKE